MEIKVGLHRVGTPDRPAELLDVLVLNLDGRIEDNVDTVKREVRAECGRRGLDLRSGPNAVATGSDYHFVAYVVHTERSAFLKEKKKPAYRSGPQGGPLGKETRRK
jgi:hypothetical protein